MLCRRNLSRYIAFFLLFSLLSVYLSSCGNANVRDCKSILYEMLACQKALPAGNVYTTSSSPGAADYLSPELLKALYGGDGLPPVLLRVREVAIRTASGLYASEFAVFLCSSRRDTEEIADLCLARIDSMKLFLNLNSDKLSIAESSRRSAENAKVAIFGNFVVMAVSENAEMSINAARDLIS